MVKLLLVAVLALAACGGDGTGDGGGSISGSFVAHEDFQDETKLKDLLGGPEALVGEPCSTPAYSESTTITVRDAEGSVVATGHPSGREGELSYTKDTGLDCAIPFQIDDVPVSDFYVLSVDGVEGETTVQADQASDVYLLAP